MWLVTTAFALGLTVCAALAAGAVELTTAKPEEVGLSSARLARITETLKADANRGRIPGAVVVIARRGHIAYAEAVGFRDKAASAPMTLDAIFRVASMTKPMVSVAAMMLYEDGKLFVSDPVSKYIPEIGKMQVGVERIDPMSGKSVVVLTPPDREMTVQDLLRHTSGLTYGNRGTTAIHKAYPLSSSAASREVTSKEFIERVARAPLLFSPGTHWESSAAWWRWPPVNRSASSSASASSNR
jgi:CubicO group peptidase (beta-lactamase class C family)